MTIANIYKLFLESSGVSTDTRKIEPNCLFFALKGPNFNANSLAKQALDYGASYAIIDEPAYESEKTILVDDVLVCLQELAKFHRKEIQYPIIGLTGSNGKTTTKELITHVLSQKYKVQSTPGNLNNHIGVALTLLGFGLDLDFGIVEMGANHQHEIEFLCTISQPDYGLITNFGKAHLEGFGGVDGVIKGKSELYNYLRKHNKIAFINYEDKIQVKQIGAYAKTVAYGNGPAVDHQINFISADPYVTLKFRNQTISSHLIGNYNFGNIAVAVAIGAQFGMSDIEIKSGIQTYQPDNNRSEIIKKGSNTIILDAYNANPTSMLAALENFNQLSSNRKVLFLGDMFELGDSAEFEHQAVVDFVEANFTSDIYFFGSNFYSTTTSNKSTKFETLDSAVKILSALNLRNCKVLIKGSRGMALERILDFTHFT